MSEHLRVLPTREQCRRSQEDLPKAESLRQEAEDLGYTHVIPKAQEVVDLNQERLARCQEIFPGEFSQKGASE